MTSGTSCGMASHFGTPISGILFTLEITPSYYFIRNYWLAALSSVIGGMLARMFMNVSSDEVSVFAPIFSDIVIPHPSWFVIYLSLLFLWFILLLQATRSDYVSPCFVLVSCMCHFGCNVYSFEFILLQTQEEIPLCLRL